MSDVDAVRFLASEHDLEFVNLDTYNVDRAAADALPMAVARRHHVVAVKKKFGTPVIAIANPNDVFALDTLRASLGRDFISVVASPEQIGRYLDKVYGDETDSVATEGAVAEPVFAEPLAPEPVADELDDVDIDDLDDSFGMSLYGSAFAPVAEEPAPEGVAEADAVNGAVVSEDPVEATSVQEVEGSGDAGSFEATSSGIEDAGSPIVEETDGESISGEAAEYLADISSNGSGDEPVAAVIDQPVDDVVSDEFGAVVESNGAAPSDVVAEEPPAEAVAEEPQAEVVEVVEDVEPVAEEIVEPVEAVAEEPQVDADAEAAVPSGVEDVEPVEAVVAAEPETVAAPDEPVADLEVAPVDAAPDAVVTDVDTAPPAEAPVDDALLRDQFAYGSEPAPGPEADAGTPDQGFAPLPGFQSFDSLTQSSGAAASPEEDGSKIFGYNPVVPGLPPTSEAFAASQEEISRLTFDPMSPPPADDDQGVLTADLVDEAVAHYEEQHSDMISPELIADDGLLASLPELAKVLIGGGRVSLEDIESVMEEHEATGQSVARILSTRKLVTEADLMWGMAQEMGLEFVDLDTIGISAAATALIPEATAKHHNVLPFALDDGVPVIAASNPTDVFAMDDLRTILGRNFVTVVATRSQITTYIRTAYQGGGDAADMAQTASLEYDRAPDTVEDIQAVTEEAPIVRYVNLLVLQALNERASDIHVEPTATDLRIRYRIDGVLHDVSTAPRSISAAVTTRLKVMADMNIAEHRVPQDGRISLNVGDRGVDLRMATLPTIYGEKIVMRVLDMSSVVLGFPDLGFDADLLETYEGVFTKPYGTILVTGPTGSGKSTTLYTTLSALNSPEKNIITVEDPVELQIKGINQVQLNVKAGLTFASALKSILRSDPDIVLVGEVRDKETAVIAIEAALTGHLVLATLHTNSAASTPMRLVEMGLEPFLVTSSLSAVLAQRLARRLCIHCKEPFPVSEAEVMAAGWTIDEIERVGDINGIHRAVGCSACSNTGYRGRKAIAELLPMTEEIQRMIIEGGTADDIQRLAVEQGMVTLRQSGLRKALAGETTLEEVLRVVA